MGEEWVKRGRIGKEEAKRSGRWRRSERGGREEGRNGREVGTGGRREGADREENEAWKIERWVRSEWTDARW